MHRLKELNTFSLIRIFNYFENDNGYGDQIDTNSLWSMEEAMLNFDWEEETVFLSIKSDSYKVSDGYIICGKDGFISESEKELRKWLPGFIGNLGTPNAELLEIIQEEYDHNGLGDVIL